MSTPRQRRRTTWLGTGLACALLPLMARAEPDLDAGVRAYRDGMFAQARDLTAQYLDQPHARLVHALCLVHADEGGELARGLAELKALYDDGSAGRSVRLEAGLSYGRMIQLLQVRHLYPEFDTINVAAFYRDYLSLAGSGRYACQAALNLAELLCDRWLKESDPAHGEEALAFVEAFIGDYAGPTTDLLPLHLLLESLYEDFRDFEKCYQHLEAAYRLGIKKVQVRQAALFKLGRLNHLKLQDPERASRHYREFLQAFPNARETPQIRRHLADLTAEAR